MRIYTYIYVHIAPECRHAAMECVHRRLCPLCYCVECWRELEAPQRGCTIPVEWHWRSWTGNANQEWGSHAAYTELAPPVNAAVQHMLSCCGTIAWKVDTMFLLLPIMFYICCVGLFLQWKSVNMCKYVRTCMHAFLACNSALLWKPSLCRKRNLTTCVDEEMWSLFISLLWWKLCCHPL